MCVCAQAGKNKYFACVRLFYWDPPWVRRRTLARRGRPNPSSRRWMLFSRSPLWRSSSLAGRPPCRRAPRSAPAAAPQAPPPAAEGSCWILNRKCALNSHCSLNLDQESVFAHRANLSKQCRVKIAKSALNYAKKRFPLLQLLKLLLSSLLLKQLCGKHYYTFPTQLYFHLE